MMDCNWRALHDLYQGRVPILWSSPWPGWWWGWHCGAPKRLLLMRMLLMVAGGDLHPSIQEKGWHLQGQWPLRWEGSRTEGWPGVKDSELEEHDFLPGYPTGKTREPWSSTNGGLRDGGLSSSESIWGKRPFSPVFWTLQVPFVPSGKKSQKWQTSGEFGWFPGREGRHPSSPLLVHPPFAAAQEQRGRTEFYVVSFDAPFQLPIHVSCPHAYEPWWLLLALLGLWHWQIWASCKRTPELASGAGRKHQGRKNSIPSDTNLLLTKNYFEIIIFGKITNLARNSLKMSFFPGHFERTKCLKNYEK